MKILIAASGTGGHLFPALHIANALKALNPAAQIMFVGSGRPLEEKILGPSGFPRKALQVYGLKSRGLAGFLQFLITFPKGFIESWSLLSSFKPDVVVGVGGYVTFFPIVLSWFRRIPTWIHEAEIFPGLANRVLSFFASKISVSFPNSKMGFERKVIFTGHPVREGLAEVRNFEAVTTIRHVLVMGGSQGADAIDQAMVGLSDFLKEHRLELRHQCRAISVDDLRQRYAKSSLAVEVLPFIEDMASAYRWADIIISRSGAGSVMELGVVNIPCIFVPFPFAQGNHQLLNAKTLADKGKALIVEEGADFEQRLKSAISTLMEISNYNQMKTLKVESRNVDASLNIAKGIVELAKIQAI